MTDPIILRRKARSLRKLTDDTRWKAALELAEKKSVVRTISQSLIRPFKLLIFEPMCLNLCVFSAILLGILYLFFGAFPLIFRAHYGFNLWQVGLTFLGIGIGLVIGVSTDPIWLPIRLFLASKYGREGDKVPGTEPEYRLLPVIVGSVIVPIGLFIFAWTTYPSVHWIAPIIGSATFGVG